MPHANDRMFQVLVVGGIALLGSAACGGETGTSPVATTKDAAADARDDVFPSELPAFADSGPAPVDAFPSELPTFLEAGSVDAGGDAGDDAFPSELPTFVDAGSIDATSDAEGDAATTTDAGFPIEK